uniref:Senescence regulator S40 n=1 Tax=Vitis vinifera TaxID=29760 RepID=F6HR24_VITVI
MATRRSYLTRPSYVYLAGEKSSSNNEEITDDIGLEFDESEVWNSGQVPSSDPFKKPIPSSRASKKPVSKKMGSVTATSLPVNIPDWSKILRDDYRLSQRKESDEDVDDVEEDDDHDSRIPPHEYLARTRVASFSVHEGIGRTLKGRDLSRVRNAIWKKAIPYVN